MEDPSFCDVLIIGSGIAGLTAAWKLVKSGKDVLVVTKKLRAESNTNYAQGGIAAVMSPTDSIDEHIHDTLIAGDGLCIPEVVKFVVSKGPERIRELINIGVHFTIRSEGELDLAREGGHSKRRVLHAGDLTGREIERALLQYCESFKSLRISENTIAIDLYRTIDGSIEGAYVLDCTANQVIRINAKYVILATGGAGKAYLVTTNPDVATGDGIAMASRAGATIANMEFTQFHPTCLYLPKARSTNFLISEALRGEGAILVDSNGKRFMDKYDSRAELAPRDIVARAIDNELKHTGAECVYLDISHKPADFIKERFPGIYERLLEFGFDLTKQSIPVVPAAHYQCGGVVTDLHARTDLPNLYCIGESSCTGLHGANRLASNSLLEGAVFAHEAYEDILSREQSAENSSDKNNLPGLPPYPPHLKNLQPDDDDRILISNNWDELRLTMWNYVGIVRSNKRLRRAMRRIQILKKEVSDYYDNYTANLDLIELRNLIEVAELIVHCAIARKESRGIHYNLDYPEKLSKPIASIIKRTGDKIEYFKNHPYFEEYKLENIVN